ncbi:hypothetical protein EMCRGX_G015618 [Ephydatia muelleri]
MSVENLHAVHYLYACVAVINVYYHVDTAACPSFNINYPPMRTLLCPGDNITYTCTFSTSTLTAVTWWSGSGFTCPANSPSNTTQLTQPTGASLNTVPVSCGNLSAVMTNVSGTCYTSVLTIPTPQYFNGTTVTCRDGSFGTLIGNDTLNIQLASPPSTPTITLSDASSNTFTVTWTSVLTATSYNVSINDCTPTPLLADTSYTVSIGNGSILISPSGLLARVLNCTNIINSSVYNVSVVAINCAGGGSPAIRTAMLYSTAPNDWALVVLINAFLEGGAIHDRPELLNSLEECHIINPIRYVLKSSNEPATTNAPTTTLQSSTSSSNSVGIEVGVSVGFVVLLLLVGIAVVIGIILINKKGSPATPKGDNYEQNEIPLPPKNTDNAPSKWFPCDAPSPQAIADIYGRHSHFGEVMSRALVQELGLHWMSPILQGAGVGLCPHGSARSWGGPMVVQGAGCKELGWVCVPMAVQGAGCKELGWVCVPMVVQGAGCKELGWVCVPMAVQGAGCKELGWVCVLMVVQGAGCKELGWVCVPMVVQGAGCKELGGSVSPWQCKELGWVCVPMVVQGAGCKELGWVCVLMVVQGAGCKELGWVCVPMVVQGAGVGLCPHGSARSWGGPMVVQGAGCKELGWVSVLMVVQGAGCKELGWVCVPMVMEAYDACGTKTMKSLSPSNQLQQGQGSGSH